MDDLTPKQNNKNNENNRNNEISQKLSTQSAFFSFSSGVFLKSSKNIALYLSSSKLSPRHLAIDVFVTSLADAIGDAYSLAFSNTASNLQILDVNLLKNFIIAFFSKFSTGIIHSIFYFLNIPIQYIIAADTLIFYLTINYGSLLIQEEQAKLSKTKILLIQNLFATFFLGLVIIITKLFIDFI